jgi:predicted PurR-regulated permease PerM
MSTDRVATALSFAALAALLYLVFLVVQPFLTPLGWAAVLAIVFYPMHERCTRRWGSSRSAALTTLASAVLVIVPLILVMSAFLREAIGGAADLQHAFEQGQFAWIQRAWRSLDQRLPETWSVNLATLVADGGRRLAVIVAAQSGSLLKNVAGFIFGLIVALFATFFFLRDSKTIVTYVRRLLPFEEPMRERLIVQTRDLVSMSVTASGIIAALQGLLGGIVFALVGIDAPVFWGVVMAFFCLIPLGAWVVYLPAAVLLALEGSIGRAAIVAGLGVGIVSAVDNVLRPLLMSGGTSMNGLLILIALLGGVQVFGVLGLVLGPILVATALALLDAYTDAKDRKPPRREAAR